MLLFSTVLDINEKMNRERFFDLIVEWNDSHENFYPENKIPDLKLDKKIGERYGSDNLWMQFQEYPSESTIAVRYEKKNAEGITWDTDYVMNFRNKKLSIRLDRSYSEGAVIKSSQFSAPYLIRLLIDKGYLKKDGDLHIDYKPIVLEDDMVPLLADIVNGNKSYKYPVVFVTKNLQNEYPVDVDKLADKLRGAAHVLVQKDRSQNNVIRIACDGKNEYNGSIGIYYPNRSFEHKKLVYRRAEGQDSYLKELAINGVSQYSNAQSVDLLFTWQGVNNAVLLDTINSQSAERQKAEEAWKNAEANAARLQGSLDEESQKKSEEAIQKVKDEAAQYIAMADEEIQALNDRIAELMNENQALRNENNGLHYKFNRSDKMPILTFGDEHDFYEGEIKDLILKTLDEAVKVLPEDSRKRDVFMDVIKNNDYRKISVTREEKLKNKIKSYDGMSPSTRQFLEDEIGFEIKEGGKHYTGFYYGDQRYVKTFSKTPSDRRSGQKMVSDISAVIY